MPPSNISQLIKQAATDAGFDLAGIATIQDADFPELARFPEWVAAGHAGEMEYLKARDEQGRLKRASLRHATPWARSVIVCARSYDSPHPLSTECQDQDEDAERGWISRYAWTEEDYHDSMLRRLRQVEARLRAAYAEPEVSGRSQGIETRCYVDTGPVVERVYARHAGVGWIGKNTCIIHERRGSFIFLGVILVSLALEPDLPAADRCGSCTRCIDACPTDALIAPGELDSRRCIAYLTIEKRGAIPEELRAGMGRQLFGCDICQDVCPWNQKARRGTALVGPAASAGQAERSSASHIDVRSDLVNPALDWLASLSVENFRRVFSHSPVKRAKFSGLRRNLAIAMGNSGERRFLPTLDEWSHGEDAVVAEHARWGKAKLEASSGPAKAP